MTDRNYASYWLAGLAIFAGWFLGVGYIVESNTTAKFNRCLDAGGSYASSTCIVPGGKAISP